MKIIDRDIRLRQIFSMVIYAVVQCISLISPYLMGKIIDVYIPEKNTAAVCFGIVLFAAIPFVSILLQTLYNYFTIKYVRKKGNEYALKIMERLMYKEFMFYNGENSLELLSYTSKEMVGYINFYIIEVGQYYVRILISFITLLILCRVNVFLAAVQLLYMPFVIFPARKMTKSVEKAVESVVSKNASINQIKGDIFKCIEYIKLYRLESSKLKEVEEKNEGINSVWGRIAALDTLGGIWADGFVTVLFTGITFGLGAILTINHSLQLGELVSAISYCGLFYASVNAAMRTTISQKKQETEYSKVLSYLEMEGEREANLSKKKFRLDEKIEFRHCNFAYEEGTPVLDDLSVCFNRGTWVGIIGASGQGKSTIFDLVTKLYPVSDGMLYVDSTDINSIDAFSIRDNITKITQNVYLFPGTIEYNLRLVNPDVSQEEIRWALKTACLSDYIDSLPQGLATDVGEAGKLMSGGERQRLSIAIGLLRKNRILLLDEVTSNLDQNLEKAIAKNLKSLVDEGYTIISISHKYDFLQYADAVYEIKNGSALRVK